ncbi:Ig-like domain-containing protein [Exiguobacterium profundum]|uniref:Ig-like domain-containing protein n=1 Tax=Exiguobacterium profundum TaxID=307643 RepID=UPI0029C1E05C|nr:Ig-like domain-containing protein [Exiguobacterium profundum]MDX5980297.1 Ig-like domain-containing protein [Exiguobacterium profundum]
MTKKKKVLTAGAAFAVAAAALTPVASVDAAQKRVIELAPMTFTGGEVKLPAKVGSSKITWYKSGIDMKKVNTWQTVKGYAGSKKVPTTIKIKIANYVVGFQQSVAPQEVEVDGKLVLPAKLKANFAVGAYFVDVKWEDAKTDKAGDYEVKGTYTRDGKTITVVAKYSVVDADLKIENVSSSVDQAAEVLSVKADVKNLKDGEKVELVVFAGRDMNAPLPAVQAEVKEGKLTVKSAKLPAGNHSFILRSGEVKTDAVNFTVEAPEVKEVKAINAKKVEVKFNKAVDASTVLDSSNALRNITLSGVPTGSTPAANPGTLTGALSEDGMTLTITASATFDGKYAFVSTDSVKTKDGKKFDAYSTVIAANDTVAPTLVSAKASAKTSTNVVTLKFSEPVSSTGAIITVNGQAASIAAGSSTDELVLTTNAPLEAGKSYAISILNVKDAAGNFMAANPSTASVTVEADVAAPVVTGLSVVRDNLVEVSFDKAINASTLAGNIRLLDANGVAQSSTSASIKPNTGGKTLLVSVAPTFNSAGNFNGTLIFSDSIKDTAGNALATTSRSVSISKDTVAPTVVGNTKYIAAGESFKGTAYANGAIVLEFNEDVAYLGLKATKLISSTGADVSARLASAAVVEDKFLVISTNAALPEGTHTLRLDASVVEDRSTAANDNAFGIYGVTVAPVQSTDTTKPVVSTTVTPTAASNATSGTQIVLTVTDNVEVDPSSLLNVNNYLLNGLPLPAGTFVTTNYAAGTATANDVDVTLNIPAGGIATTSSNYTLNVNNLKDKAGNVIAPFVATGLSLVDDKAPELTSANISSNGLLILGFSEAVDAVNTSTTEGDFELRVGSTPINNTQIAFTDGAGTDAGKYVVTVTATIDEGVDGNAATTADNRLFIDNNGDGDYNTGDILIRTGVTGAIGTSTLNLNDLSSLQVSTVATPSVVTDSSSLNNLLKGGKVITVK